MKSEKLLKKLRIYAILGIITIILIFACGLTILLLSIIKTINLHLAVGIILSIWSLCGIYVGLMTSIWLLVSINKKRIIKPFVNASSIACYFSLNPFVILAGRLSKKTANALNKEFETPIIDPQQMRQKLYDMIQNQDNK